MANYGSIRECSRDDWTTHNSENKVAVTKISNVPDLENVKFHQLNDHTLCKVTQELRTIPTNKQFSGEEWKTDPLKRFKQIKSQIYNYNLKPLFIDILNSHAFLVYDYVHLFKNIRNNWITVPHKELALHL